MILFKDIAHLYIGCKLQVESPIKDTFVGELTPTHYATFVSHNGTIMGAKVTPILLPLSAMTDKDMRTLVDIDGANPYGIKSVEIHKGKKSKALSVHYKDNDGNQSNIYFSCLSAKKVAFLLRRRYDLFNLIENGQAIDATTLEVNPYK